MITVKQFKEKTIKRFWSKIKFGKINKCWEWQWGLSRYGYGHFRCKKRDGIGNTNMNAQRYAWKILIGDLSTHQEVLHKCDNRKCCNPNHLFIGSKIDNIKDRDSKRRQAFGSRNGTSKLNEAKVRSIRKKLSDGVIQSDLVKEYNISKAVISKINNFDSWKHVV